MATGTLTTYNLTTGVKLNVENIIWVLSPTDVPLQGTMGADGRSALSSDTCFEKKIEWLDEVLLMPNSNLAATANTADTYITVSSTAANAGVLNFQTGDVLVIDSPSQVAGVTGVQETVYVTGYGTTANTLTVTRAFAGSTAVIHSNTVTVKGVGQANPEGSDAGSARAVDRVDRFNYNQIFGPVVVQVSGTENSIQKYGLTTTEFDKQVGNRIKETCVNYELALLYGITYENAGTGQRTMGGISSYITTNVDLTTTVLTETALLSQLKACFDNGGSPDRLVMGSRQKQVMSQVQSANIRYAQDTNIRGQKIDYYDSDFGRQMLILDRWCRPSDIFIFERDQATMATLRPLTFEMLAKTGDSSKGQVIGEKSLWYRKQSHSAQLNALT